MKARVGPGLAPLIEQFAKDPGRQDAFERATRVKALFDQVPTVKDEQVVPQRSVLREFIGGSSLLY